MRKLSPSYGYFQQLWKEERELSYQMRKALNVALAPASSFPSQKTPSSCLQSYILLRESCSTSFRPVACACMRMCVSVCLCVFTHLSFATQL